LKTWESCDEGIKAILWTRVRAQQISGKSGNLKSSVGPMIERFDDFIE